MVKEHYLIRSKDGTFEVIHCSPQDATRKGFVLMSDKDPQKLNILLDQLTMYSSWRVVVESAPLDENILQVSTSEACIQKNDQKSIIEQPCGSVQHTEMSEPSTSGLHKKHYDISDDSDPYATDVDQDYVPGDTPSSSESDHSEAPTSGSVRRVLFAKTEEETFENRTHTEDEIDLPQERSLPFLASVKFNIKTSKVIMDTQARLHKGVCYECNLCEIGGYTIGFFPQTIPGKDHKCEHPPPGSKNWIYMLIERSLTTTKAIGNVYYCAPVGNYEGNEFSLSPGVFTVPLMLSSIKKQLIKGKKHSCFFCHKMIVEITSHLRLRHSEQPEVATILKLPVNSKERTKGFRQLRLKGDLNYNKSVNISHRIPIRKLSVTQVEHCVTCPKCHGLFAPRNFARHERKCTGRVGNRKLVTAEYRAKEDIDRLPTDQVLKQKFLSELLDTLRDDDDTHVILSDSCLKELCERYAYMHRGNPTALRNDRQHLRRLARLLVEIREVDSNIIDYEDCILNGDYDSVLEGICRLCYLNDATGEFEKPALAQVMRSSVTLLAKVLANSYLKKKHKKDSPEYQNVQRFLTMHEENYGVYIGRSAGRTRLYKKAKKQTPLPDSKDIKLFCTYLAKQATEAYANLKKNGFNYVSWYKLGQVELVRTIIFNRRRVSEVALMSLELYRKRKNMDDAKKKTLTVLEKALADRYSLMTLVAKRSRILHLLLDQDQCKHLDLFLEFRDQAGVPESNDYLFGIPTRVLYIDPSSAIRKFSFECGAKQPYLLRSTYLRKQVATMSQLLSLNDNQIAQVARFMGHTKEVHNDFYRQDEQSFQMTAWAKFLSIVDENDFQKFKGKSLEEIVNLMEDYEIEHIEHSDSTLTEDSEVDDPPDSLKVTFPEADIQDLDDLDAATASLDVEAGITEEVANTSSNERKSSPKSKRRSNRKKLDTNAPVESGTPKKQTINHILHTLQTSPRVRHHKRKTFTPDEVKLMSLHFNRLIDSGSLAPLAKCQDLVNNYPNIFPDRCGRDIYNWVQYKRNKKIGTKKNTV